LEVRIPKPDSWYLQVAPLRSESKLSGPYHDSGDPWQTLKLSKSEINVFRQGNRIMSETSVFHQKVDGVIYVIPGLKKARPLGGKPASSGSPYYEVNLKWRSGTTWFTSSSITTTELLLTGEESYGYTGGDIHHAFYVTRTSPWTYAANYLHTFSTGSWGNYWASSRTGLIVEPRTADRARYKNGTITGTPPVELNSKGQIRGAGHSLSDGIILARQSLSAGNVSGSFFDSPKYFMDAPDFSMSEIRSWINKLVNPDLLNDLPSLNQTDWGELVHQATANLDANSANMIAFIRDLKDIKSLIPKLKELGKLKTHASNFLAFEYGVMPTISDLESIFEAFKADKYYDRSGFRRVSAYDIVSSEYDFLDNPTPIQHTKRVHVAVNDRDTGLDALVEKARSIGVFPSLTNIWDLVPYSFVIDWFIDVGSVLERIDTKHRLSNLEIPYVILSDKIESFISLSDPVKGVGASLTFSRYSRTVTTSVPQPRIFGDVNKPPSVQNHWIEGSALILQRTK